MKYLGEWIILEEQAIGKKATHGPSITLSEGVPLSTGTWLSSRLPRLHRILSCG